MNSHEAMINQGLAAIQAEPEQALRDRVLRDAGARTAAPRPLARRISVKAAAIAATVILASLSLTTVWALSSRDYGPSPIGRDSAVERLRAGELAAKRIERFLNGKAMSRLSLGSGLDAVLENILYGDEPDGQLPPESEVKSTLRDISGSIYLPGSVTFMHYRNIGEAEAACLYEIAVPGFLPEGLAFDAVGAAFFDEEAVQRVYTRYSADDDKYVMLTQIKTVPEDYPTLTTVRYIEKAMVGENEAILEVTDEGAFALYWIKDGYLYRISAGGYDAETILAIAESI